MPSYKQVVPCWRSYPLGKLSPVEVYEKVRGENSFLLETVRPHPVMGRYSFIGFDPYQVFKSRLSLAGKQPRPGNPLEKMKAFLGSFKLVGGDDLPPFSGGAAGYLSYEVRHLFERLPGLSRDDLKLPDIYFVFTDKVIAFDYYNQKLFIICQSRPGGYSLREAERELDLIEEKINGDSPHFLNSPLFLGSKIESNVSRDEFKSMVRQAKEYIKAGDIYQANLSQRLSASIEGDPWRLYKILRDINPSPFAAYLDFDEVKIVSSSPERLLMVRGDQVETRPIAGTRPRGRDQREDKRFSRELILSPKERAEHIMLVDLERNDLGRVCQYGTVEVNELMTLENYSHVIHIVSNVRGKLRPGLDRFSALEAAFPGGTITGTPKIRSMEIIDELEKVARSIYTGSIGYFNYGGEMDLNIVIRTFVITARSAYIQVGAGIVADSDPEREYYETLHKAQALIEAVKRTGDLQIKRSAAFLRRAKSERVV